MPSQEPVRTESGNEAAAKHGWKKTFDALSISNYRLYWLGSLCSFFANYILIPSQAWLAYKLTHSAFQLGLVSAAQGVPLVLLVLFSGVIIDRVQKRSIIILTQSVTVIITLTIAILILTGLIQYWHLLLSSFLSGVILSFNIPTRYSIVAELVPKEKIFNAFALNNGGSNAARVAGPALAGVLIAVGGTQTAYFCAVGFYIIGVITMTMLKPSSKLVRGSSESMIKNLIEGARFLRFNNILIILLIMELIVTLCGMPYQGLLPVFADILQINSKLYGFMLSAIGVGALIGALAVASMGNFRRKGLLLLLTGSVFGVVVVLFANSANIGNALNMSSFAYYLSILWLMAIGICSSSYTATSSTVFQMTTSDEFRGRVTGYFSIIVGIHPISIMIAGAMAEKLSAPLTLTILGTSLTAFMLIMLFTNRRIRAIG